MSGTSGPPSDLLGDVLLRALDRTVGTSLDSLHLLREAVRNYTAQQRRNGVQLDQILIGLGSALTDARDGKTADIAKANSVLDLKLGRQLREWCQEDFRDGHAK